MIEKKIKVACRNGMDIEPASDLSYEASNYRAKAQIIFGHHIINVRSLLNLIAVQIRCGDEITLRCDGEDEEEAIKVLAAIIERP